MSWPLLSHQLQIDSVQTRHHLTYCLLPDRSPVHQPDRCAHTRRLPLIGNQGAKPSSWAAQL